jgi:hypothetical protein
LEQKSEIVETPNNVKPIAWRFNVQTKQIRMWKRQLEAEENLLPVYPTPCTAEERFAIEKVKTKFTWHKGWECFLNNKNKHFIIFTFELYWEQGIPVSAKLLSLDLMRQYLELQDIPARNMFDCVRLYLKVDENITCRWIMHMAQNETDFDFDINPRYMLERKGGRSVNGNIIDCSSHLTAVLAVLMSCVKLPAYVVFKGV